MNERFIDVHRRIVKHLESRLGVRTSGSIPADLTTAAVVVFDVTGRDDGFNEWATFDVQVFAPTRDEAWLVAEESRRAMFALAGNDPSPGGDQLIDSVRTVVRPTRRDYRNPGVERYVATYEITSRVQ